MFNTDLNQLLFDLLPYGVVYQDAIGFILHANPAAQEMLGLDLDQMTERSSTDPRWKAVDRNGNDFPGESHPAMTALRTGKPVRDVTMGVVTGSSNEYRWLLVNSVPYVKPGDNRPCHVISIFSDITARRSNEQALADVQESFRATFEQAAVGLAHVSTTGQFLAVNERLCHICGYSREEMLQFTFQDITYPADSQLAVQLTEKLLQGHLNTFSLDKRYVRKDGSVIWIGLTVSVTNDINTNEPKYFIAVVEDIHERKETEEALSKVDAQQRVFVREMLSSLTEGKLHLCDSPSHLPAAAPVQCSPIALTEDNLRLVRQTARSVAGDLGYDYFRISDLETAVGEAVMNASVHAGGGSSRICYDPMDGLLQVWIEDKGKGIDQSAIHRATLERGYTTAGSMGHGFWLMLKTTDRLYLLTGAGGTTVVLEMDRRPLVPVWLQ